MEKEVKPSRLAAAWAIAALGIAGSIASILSLLGVGPEPPSRERTVSWTVFLASALAVASISLLGVLVHSVRALNRDRSAFQANVEKRLRSQVAASGALVILCGAAALWLFAGGSR